MSNERVAIVTGAAQGVGLVTASTLAERGYRTILTDIQSLDGAVAKVTARGSKAGWHRRRHLIRGIRARACAARRARLWRGCGAGQQCRNQHDLPGGGDQRGSLAEGHERQSARAVPAEQISRRPDVGATFRQHHQCCIRGGTGRDRPPQCLQRIQTWPDRVDAHAGGGVGRAGSPCERRVSRLDQNARWMWPINRAAPTPMPIS